MATVVYALFDSAEAAARAETTVRAEHGRGGSCVLQSFDRAPLDGNILPEGATEFGRNLVIAMLAGAAFMSVAGGIVGGLDLLLGMGVGMGIALGFVTGLLMGLVGAMQAGTRIPKPVLRALEPRLARGCILLIVEPVRAQDCDAVVTTLEQLGPSEFGTCGGM
jgi:hypothetical protein